MRLTSSPWTALRALGLAGLALAAALCLAPAPAAAQIVARVNGEPITEFDVAQRAKLIQLSTRKQASRKESIDELIDEKLKLTVAKRYVIVISDREINAAYANMARRMGATPDALTRSLAGAGITADTLKSKIKADMIWGQLVRGKFQGSFQIGEKDIAQALQQAGKDGKDQKGVAYRYTLRPILFIVPRGASPAAFADRRREAEGLRGRFASCDEGVALARGLRDVAVRETIVRYSVDLSPQQREIIDGLAVGKLTPPDITPSGVEMFAVCDKRQAVGDTPGEREARDKLMQQRFEAESKRFIQELRRAALIEMR